MASTKHDDYKHDQGWEGIPDREHEYEQKEYDEYARHRELDMVSRAPAALSRSVVPRQYASRWLARVCESLWRLWYVCKW